MNDLLLDGLIIEPMEHPYEVNIINDKDFIEFNIVKDTLDACEIKILRISKSACIIYNKYALLGHENANREINNTIIAGAFYIVGINKQGKLTSLTDKQKKKYTQKFWEIELFTEDEITYANLESLFDM